jgi:hypothetical protein
LKRFARKKKKPSHYERKPVSEITPKQPVIPPQINSFEDPDENFFTGQGMIGQEDARNVSARSGIHREGINKF